jgi:nucleotide-binding universal stress UspA family protein
MSRVILAGFDPETQDASPARFGVSAAQLTGASLVVASVCAEPDTLTGYPHPDIEDLGSDATSAQERLAVDLDAGDVSIEGRALRGTSAARALHEAAEREDAGMLVVGSTGRGALGRVLPGSTAERLMHGAPCAIAVVPHGWQGRPGEACARSAWRTLTRAGRDGARPRLQRRIRLRCAAVCDADAGERPCW